VGVTSALTVSKLS